MIQRILNLFKKKKDISLVHVHTFKNGTKLYTYKKEDWGNISSRYYSAIQSHLAHVEILGQTKAEFTTTIKTLQDYSLSALEAAEFKNYVKFTTDVKAIADMWENKVLNITSVNNSLISEMFCCFFLLEDEAKYGYEEANNARKLALLEREPEMREVFFSQVKATLESWLGTYEQDIHTYLVKLHKEMESMKLAGMNQSLNINKK